jgi:phenylpyruvate tautomerase PptA (4-oxalocrotonate tautomerase family)
MPVISVELTEEEFAALQDKQKEAGAEHLFEVIKAAFEAYKPERRAAPPMPEGQPA